MPKASDLKKGDVVEIQGAPHTVRTVEARSPSSRGASTLYKIRFVNLRTRQKLDQSLKGDDMLPASDSERVEVQYSYIDGDDHVFMNTDDYSQYNLSADALSEELPYLVEGMDGLIALIVDGAIVGITLPQTVVLEVVETTPGIKGATATGRTKPARLQTGLEIQVPEYLEPGERVKVNTDGGKFISRAG